MNMTEFDRACVTDPTVYEMTRRDASLEDVIIALVNEKLKLQLALAKALSNTSRIVVLEDGRELVIHPSVQQMERYDLRELHNKFSTDGF